MYSDDIERVLSSLNTLKDTLASQIDRLIELTKYRIWNTEHVHPMHNPVVIEGLSFVGVGTTELERDYEDSNGEDYHPIQTAEITTPILTKYHTGFEPEYLKVQNIKAQLYKPENSINNQYGSPWTEFTKLTERIQKIEQFANQHPTLDWINEKRSLMELLQLALTFTIDAKWALTHYYDLLSRGYDRVYNQNNESVQWEFNIAKDKNSKKGSNFVKDELDKYTAY